MNDKPREPQSRFPFWRWLIIYSVIFGVGQVVISYLPPITPVVRETVVAVGAAVVLIAFALAIFWFLRIGRSG